MCGIVGIIGKYTRLDDKLIKSLLHLDIIRGKDSTGIFSVDNQEEIMWYKDAVLPMQLCATKAYDQVLTNAVGGQGVIGHNRAATLGVVNKENSHPFYHDGIIGVHNGTLNELPPVDKKFGTDSEAIFYDLSKRTAKEVVEDLDGAFALVWYSQNDSKWYVCRNDERPLHYFKGDDKGSDQLIISSEAGILYAAASRAGYPSIKPEHIEEFKQGVLYSISVSRENGLTKVTMEEEEVTLKDLWPSYGNYNNGYGYGWASNYTNQGKLFMEEKLGIKGGWYPATVRSIIAPFQQGRGTHTVYGKVKIKPNVECKFIMYDRNPPKVDEDIYVYVEYLSNHSHGNRDAVNPEDFTVTCDDWSSIDMRSGFADSETYSCINCGDTNLPLDKVVAIYADGTTEHVCTYCCDCDSTVEQYVNMYAIN